MRAASPSRRTRNTIGVCSSTRITYLLRPIKNCVCIIHRQRFSSPKGSFINKFFESTLIGLHPFQGIGLWHRQSPEDGAYRLHRGTRYHRIRYELLYFSNEILKCIANVSVVIRVILIESKGISVANRIISYIGI